MLKFVPAQPLGLGDMDHNTYHNIFGIYRDNDTFHNIIYFNDVLF